MQALFRWLDPLLNPLACLPPQEEASKAENAEALLNRLDDLLRRKLKHALAGDQPSALKGQGLDFADLREYTPGDDIRKMDWNVFARTMTPHVREYHEEKQLTLWLVVDLTPSMQFGQRRPKTQQAIELAGLFCLLAERAGHKLGAYLILSDEAEIIPPTNSRAHFRHVLQRLMTFSQAEKPARADTAPFPAACQQLSHVVAKQSTVILLSDFLTLQNDWKGTLGKLAHKAQLLSLLLCDPVEAQLPEHIGMLPLQDPETSAQLLIDTHHAASLSAYRNRATQFQEDTLTFLKTLGPATLASSNIEAIEILLSLLKAGLRLDRGGRR